jgi:DNA-binding PadR family transcriptional regulator
LRQIGGRIQPDRPWPAIRLPPRPSRAHRLPRQGSCALVLDVSIVVVDADNGDFVPHNVIIGEFEQLVLLVMLRLGGGAHALAVREGLSEAVGRRVGRGTLYRTLERLEEKGYVRWKLESGTPERGGHPRRLFMVTARGIAALRASRHTLLELWAGLEDVL